MQPFEIDWWPRRIICGPDAAGRLHELVSGLGRTRALVVCGASIAASASLGRVREQLGDRFAGAFQEVEMNAPLPILRRGADAARAVSADVIVSLGGGSAIDSGKGICLIHQVGDDYPAYALRTGGGGGAAKRVPDLGLAHIAIPTTTGSGSEVAPTCGLRDPALGHKRIFRDDRLIPDIAILDPQCTLETPARLTACSGMTAVARCIEALYSGRRNPLRAALALHGLQMLIGSLPITIAEPHNADARAECLVASAMSAVAANVNTSAVHAIGHVVGGTYGLQHGIAHAILLSGAMRMMLPLISDQQKSVLRALGGSSEGLTADQAGSQAADRMSDFVGQLPLPHRLRDVGVEEAALEAVAEHAGRDPILRDSGANMTAGEILAMLRSVY